MKVIKREGNVERTVLIGMITNKHALARISPKWEKNIFASKWANIIGGWCVRYYNKYKEAPKRNIEGIFESWSEKQEMRDKGTLLLVEKFLASLSEEYEQGPKRSAEYLVDMASQHFNQVKLKLLAETLQGDVDAGDLEKAISRVNDFNRVDIGLGVGVDILQDKEAFLSAYDKSNEILIKYPGELGVFFGDSLCRDGFIAMQGPEKRGKSFWLYDIVWRAMLQGRKVAYFVIGDMSQHQVYKRLGARAAKHPYKIKGGFPGSVNIPTRIRKDPDSKVAEVEFEERKYKKPLTKERVWAKIERMANKDKKSMLKLSCHPSLSVTVPDIESIIRGWERSGWGIPDVLVIDYADNIASSYKGIPETRNQINMTWKQLRALSQSLHCLLMTATQADAGSYRVETQTRMNFSEDKRKYAEVTGMIGINQTLEEKALGVERLNWIQLREEDFSETLCIHVAGCLSLSSPAIKSCF